MRRFRPVVWWRIVASDVLRRNVHKNPTRMTRMKTWLLRRLGMSCCLHMWGREVLWAPDDASEEEVVGACWYLLDGVRKARGEPVDVKDEWDWFFRRGEHRP